MCVIRTPGFIYARVAGFSLAASWSPLPKRLAFGRAV